MTLKDLIKHRRLQVNQLASKAGISPATVHRALRGETISELSALKIADALDWDISDIQRLYYITDAED